MKGKAYIDDLEYRVTGACIEVHKFLGPGLLESTYQTCLEHELHFRNISFISEHKIKLNYKGRLLESNLRIDLLIENCLLIELKSVDNIAPIHQAQILTYMKLMKIPKGLLINFNCMNIVEQGKRSFVNEHMPFY